MLLSQRVGSFICACVVMLRVSVCFAQADTPVELTWEAPKNCPQESEVQKQLRALAGTSGGEQSRSFQAHGTVAPLDARYRLTLFIVRSATHGTRIIESDECRSLAKAAAVILGLLVQKEKALGRELSESEINGQPEQPQEPLLQGADASSLWHFLLRAPLTTVDFITLPRVGYGIGLSVGVAHRTWRALVRGTYYKTENVTSPGFDPYQVKYGRESLDALGCYGWRSGLIEVAPCADLSADRVAAHASGDSLLSRDKTALWFSIGSGISGYLYFHRHVALVAMGTGRFTTNRARFLVGTVTGTDQAQRVPLVTFDASLACEWIF